ncbi:MAG TPA: formylglycine-generating enzyme family protein [Pyrinomonadaceae bacterium]|nr:formylglycine-generating enzyme family protein [Pyrinomonadaceae bacterium]
MVEVPAGSFCMGSRDPKPGFGDQLPRHRVTVPAFYIGKYEVTQTQWRAVMGNNPSSLQGDDLPVEQVSWNDAQQYISRLNQISRDMTYRLPTEAEWEYACRAGNDEEIMETDSEIHAVGTRLRPNAFGLSDMLANVYEWCLDLEHDDYSGAPTNGAAWLSGASSKKRMLRGGGDCAFRRRNPSTASYSSDGFRIVAVARTR